jgi:hypothetical protein
LNRFLLAIPENYENLFDPSSFSDNTLSIINLPCHMFSEADIATVIAKFNRLNSAN